MKKRTKEKIAGDFSSTAYLLGIMSIVFAFFTPVAGFILGIIGLLQSKKQNTALSKRGKKFSIIGIVLSVIMLIISIAVAAYVAYTGASGLSSFPI